jgi:predicted short-subunit dehydrogenase-like oxidoreductase (DUF2520 family)
MTRKLTVTIVGPGSLGTSLARALHGAGIVVPEIVYRDQGKSAKEARDLAASLGARAAPFSKAGLNSTVVWLCVGDSVIAETAEKLAPRRSWKGSIVFHSGGAMTSDELQPLRKFGARVASVHPMMTFVRSARVSIQGVTFALEGDQEAMTVARRVVKALGGESFAIAKKDKPLYHALGAFVSPLVVAQMATAEKIGRELKLRPEQTRKIIAPILQQTIRNYVAHGPAAAFSGPIVRGDRETVQKNLTALKRVGGAKEIYRALARMAVEELPSKDRRGIKEALG